MADMLRFVNDINPVGDWTFAGRGIPHGGESPLATDDVPAGSTKSNSRRLSPLRHRKLPAERIQFIHLLLYNHMNNRAPDSR